MAPPGLLPTPFSFLISFPLSCLGSVHLFQVPELLAEAASNSSEANEAPLSTREMKLVREITHGGDSCAIVLGKGQKKDLPSASQTLFTSPAAPTQNSRRVQVLMSGIHPKLSICPGKEYFWQPIPCYFFSLSISYF